MQKLNLIGAFNNQTSYSLSTVKITQELLNLGVDITVFPIGGNSNDEEVAEIINKCHHRIKVPKTTNTPCLKIWHEFALWEHVSRPYYGFPIFELDNFKDNTKASLDNCNNLITCSSWGKEVLLKNTHLTEEEVHVCPLGVDSKIFRPRIKPQSDKYIFINVAKWEYRKHSRLMEIFNKAFEPSDNVELYLVPHNPFISEQKTKNWVKHFKDSKLGNKIKIFPRQSILGLLDLMKISDCMIYPTHSEGFGLTILESMAMGIPVITTRYSAMCDYCTNENSFLVDITEKEPAKDNLFFHGEGNWAKIGDKQVDQFADYMRYCYKNRINSNLHGVKTGEKFSWSNSAKILNSILF